MKDPKLQRERREFDLREVLELIQQNVDQGRMHIVSEAIRDEISQTTLQNWLKNKDRAVRAYKAGALLRIRDKIPKPADVKKYEAYKFALDELGLDPQSQLSLRRYDGRYAIYHRFGKVKLRTLLLGANSAPSFATFIFRYRAYGRRHDCDGLVVVRGTTIFFLGLAKESMFFSVMGTVADPRKDYIKGFGTFQDFNEGRTYRSNMVLAHSSHELTPIEYVAIEEYLEQPGATRMD